MPSPFLRKWHGFVTLPDNLVVRRTFVFGERGKFSSGERLDLFREGLNAAFEAFDRLLLFVHTLRKVLVRGLLVRHFRFPSFQPLCKVVHDLFSLELDDHEKSADDQVVSNNRTKKYGLASLVLLAALGLSSCETLGDSWNTSAQHQAVVDKVLATGKSLLGKKPDAKVEVNGRSFTLDCVGTVSAAWWGAGIDLQRDFRKYRGDAVNRLYGSLQSWGALDWQRTPSPGDLIVWDHTWDVDNDPNFPDGHTHVGMVVSVSSNGQVTYLHESATRGVTLAYMNLYAPSVGLDSHGRVVNSPMYLGSNFGLDTNPSQWTSGQLWSAFGDAHVVVSVLG